MTNAPLGIILVTPTDVVKISRNQNNGHIGLLNPPNVVTQAIDPQGVLPVMTAPGRGIQLFCQISDPMDGFLIFVCFKIVVQQEKNPSCAWCENGSTSTYQSQ
jgi:hypothetical protein